jgi:hypothetical protein
VTDDPLAAVAALEGVGSAAAHARDAVDALLRHPALRRDAARVAASSALQAARADAELEDADPDDAAGAVLRGSLRVGAELPSLARTWERAPLQALARVHLLLARDLVPADALGRIVGRGDRVGQLSRLATAPTEAPAVVVAAVVHGELAAAAPFAGADRLLARAVERVVLVSRGVDTKAVTVPSAGHLALRRAYDARLGAYASGAPAGVGAWVRHCLEAYAIGAEVVARDLAARS